MFIFYICSSHSNYSHAHPICFITDDHSCWTSTVTRVWNTMLQNVTELDAFCVFSIYLIYYYNYYYFLIFLILDTMLQMDLTVSIHGSGCRLMQRTAVLPHSHHSVSLPLPEKHSGIALLLQRVTCTVHCTTEHVDVLIVDTAEFLLPGEFVKGTKLSSVCLQLPKTGRNLTAVRKDDCNLCGLQLPHDETCLVFFNSQILN